MVANDDCGCILSMCRYYKKSPTLGSEQVWGQVWGDNVGLFYNIGTKLLYLESNMKRLNSHFGGCGGV